MKKTFQFLLLLVIFSSCKEEIKSNIKEEIKEDLKEKVEEYEKNDDRFEIISSKFEYSTKNINSFNPYLIKFRIELKNISEDILTTYYYDYNRDNIYVNFKYNDENVLEKIFPSGGNNDFVPKTKTWNPQEIKIIEGKLDFNLPEKYLEKYFEFSNSELKITITSEDPIENHKRQEIKFDISDDFKSMLKK